MKKGKNCTRKYRLIVQFGGSKIRDSSRKIRGAPRANFGSGAARDFLISFFKDNETKTGNRRKTL
jgi:hypothetical protein